MLYYITYNIYMELDIIVDFIQNKHITHLVVHGLKTKQHTHRYIHESIYNTFVYIADRCSERSVIRPHVIWCEDTQYSTKIYTPVMYNPESNYLIFSTPHLETDKYLPILKNAYYIVHYRKGVVYSDVPITKYDYLLQTKRAVKYVEFRYDPTNTYYHGNNMTGVMTIDKTPFWFDTITNEAHLAWATNLLPEEINANIELIRASNEPLFKLQSYFCGSVWRVNEADIAKWIDTCKLVGIDSICERQKVESIHQQMVRESFLSHAIQGESQRQSDIKYYIPCRILKNISYGAIPITNNIGVYNMLKDHDVVYDIDMDNLIKKALDRHKEILDNYDDYKRKQIRVMEYVRDHHTFLNRIATIIQCGFCGDFVKQANETLKQVSNKIMHASETLMRASETLKLMSGTFKYMNDPFNLESETLNQESETLNRACETLNRACETLNRACETLNPVSETVIPVSETVIPVSETVIPVSETVIPVSETVNPVSETVSPESETVDPEGETLNPEGETLNPVSETVDPESETLNLESETLNPVSETLNPESETLNPVSETLNPVSETLNPVSETLNPVSETLNPVSETLNSVSETLNSVSETLNSVSETLNSVSETLNPVSEIVNQESETVSPESETLNPESEIVNPESESADGNGGESL